MTRERVKNRFSHTPLVYTSFIGAYMAAASNARVDATDDPRSAVKNGPREAIGERLETIKFPFFRAINIVPLATEAISTKSRDSGDIGPSILKSSN